MSLFSTLLLTALQPVSAQPVALEPTGTEIAPVLAVSQETQEAIARNFNYTFVELNYRKLDDDDSDANADGLQLAGSYAFKDVQNEFLRKTFAFASYSSLDDDVELDEFQIGGGYAHPMSDKLDLVGTFALVHQEVDAGAVDDDDTGFEIGGGGRMWVADKIEVNGRLVYRDVFDDDFGLGIGGRYYATEALSLGLNLEFVGDIDELRFGVRWQF